MNNVAQYQNVQVLTADRVRIVIMLYDGIIRFNGLAQKAIGERNVEARTKFINRSIDIINELQNSLNMEEGGEVARNLSRLYDFSLSQLMEANIRNNPALIDSVTRVIKEVKAGWEGIASEKARQQPEHRSISNGI